MENIAKQDRILSFVEVRVALALLGKPQKWVEEISGRCHATVSRFMRGRDVWPDCRADISRAVIEQLRAAGHWDDAAGIIAPQGLAS